ncbi:hypothetical protein ACFS5N_13685 [Mucilaginibacter ximonensis]|uniref:Uncharacterized protein n=1 Tax=Mucilaginibacter ximonensis TaxID=538021 RepID=A0ABW5YE37_9SPHI
MNATGFKINCFWIVLTLLFAAPASAQTNRTATGYTSQLKNFTASLAQIDVSFNFPEGFKEIKAPNTDSYQFDYAMILPDADFEIWFRVNTQKENEKLLADKNIKTGNPDSLFLSVAQDQIGTLTSEKIFSKRKLPQYILDRYNADEGCIYLVSIDDSPVTKHYKYAFVTVLQKNGSGTVLAIAFTNDKGPEFFKNMQLASTCLKFKG